MLQPFLPRAIATIGVDLGGVSSICRKSGCGNSGGEDEEGGRSLHLVWCKASSEGLLVSMAHSAGGVVAAQLVEEV